MSVTPEAPAREGFRHRWDAIEQPGWAVALRDLALRVLAPAVALWAAIVGIGELIVGPLGGLQSESAVNRRLQQGRTPLWDQVTSVWSHVGNTEIVIAVCVVMVGVIWWVTRRWWVAILPAIAISLQATVFVLATMVVGRPRPDVEKLDPAPPTSSYPSGHVGASTALYLTLALLAGGIRSTVLRRAVTTVCLIIPFLVLYARLYRGMHHVTDVVVGLLNGIACALLAWGWLRRRGSSAR